MIEQLYIHVPFCARKKCGYCAFYSIPWEKSAENAYITKITDEIERKSQLCAKLKSIYIGGGTPSSLSEKSLEQLFNTINRNLKFADKCEISIESNPDTLTPTKVEIIANFASRLSIGVQSFSPKNRKILDRKSTNRDIFSAFEFAEKYGIRNISCDLINSMPGQNVNDYTSDLQTAIRLGVKHISSYSIIFEENSKISKYGYLNDEETELVMWNISNEILQENGFHRYEVSNFAKKNFECFHNLEIWFGAKYLGIGPSACSFDGKTRWTEIANFAKWLNGSDVEYDIISPRKRAAEILAFGFRTTKKWTAEKFKERTGFNLNSWNNVLSELSSDALIYYSKNEAYSTEKGLLLWNSLAEKIINNEEFLI